MNSYYAKETLQASAHKFSQLVQIQRTVFEYLYCTSLKLKKAAYVFVNFMLTVGKVNSLPFKLMTLLKIL